MRIDPGAHQRLDLDQVATDLPGGIGNHPRGGHHTESATGSAPDHREQRRSGGKT